MSNSGCGYTDVRLLLCERGVINEYRLSYSFRFNELALPSRTRNRGGVLRRRVTQELVPNQMIWYV